MDNLHMLHEETQEDPSMLVRKKERTPYAIILSKLK
jgi:hypothetical protein